MLDILLSCPIPKTLHRFPHVLLISMTAVIGALLIGMSSSYFLNSGFTPAAISGGRGDREGNGGDVCAEAACIGSAVATSAAAVMSAAFQTWYKKRLDARESGEDIEVT